MATTASLQGPILRVFTATPRAGASDAVASNLQNVSTALVRSRSGLVGHLVAHPIPGDDRAHLFLTAWEDLDALVAFTGDRWTQAVLPEGYADLLADWTVTHYSLGGVAFAQAGK